MTPDRGTVPPAGSEPRTAAGRSLDDECGDEVVAGGSIREYILRIEAEARSLAPESEGLRLDLYRGRVEAFDAVLACIRQINGNGHDEPSDPALDAVYDKVADLRSRATAALAVCRAALNPESET